MISEQKLYIITRSDLSPGLQIAQSCHALREFVEIHPKIDKAWYKDSNYLVILSVNNEFSLELLIEKAKENDIKFALFREPDLDDQITAVAFEPSINSKHLFRDLPLAGKMPR